METDNSKLLQKYKDKIKVALLPIKMQGTFYDRIEFPEVPVNLKMLLTDIELPEKAKLGDGEGINGSLYNKPIKDILKRANDKGFVVFTKHTIPEIKLLQESTNILDQYKHLTQNSFIQSLLEGSDIDQPGLDAGTEIEVDHKGTENQRQKTKNSIENKEPNKNMIDAALAIDDVVSASLNGITTLLRTIGSDVAEIKNLTKTISDMNDASYRKINEWMDSNNEVLKSVSNSAKTDMQLSLQNSKNVTDTLTKLYAGTHQAYELVLPLDDSKKQKLTRIVQSYTNSYETKIKSVDIFIADLIKDNLIRRKQTPTNNFIIQEQDNINPIFEADDIEGQDTISYDFDDIYREYLSTIKRAIAPMLVSEPENWSIIKTARKQMEDLKKRTDEEISNKIDIICRTGNAATQDLSGKFKSALSKHPLRAEGLKTLWKRYSVELDQRLENRLKQLYDLNGNGTAIKFAQDFLSETYPNILATLLTYKTLLYTLQKEHKDYLSQSQLSDEEIEEQAQQLLDNEMQLLRADLWAINLEEQN